MMRKKRIPKVLLACEESQAVAIEMRKIGIEAYSCDILPCSGSRPEWHIQGDIFKVLNPTDDGELEAVSFSTADGKIHIVEKWDMIIAFPPCTFLTATGNRWFNVEKYGDKAIERIRQRELATQFVERIWLAKCDRVVIENPIGYLSTHFRKPSQIVHPYYFAEKENDENCERKATCLWIRGKLPLLQRLNYEFEPRIIKYKNGKGTDSPWHLNTISLPPAERAKARAKTFPGVAKAMATQWGEILLKEAVLDV